MLILQFMFNDVRLQQPSNVSGSNVVALFVIVRLVRVSQLTNTPAPIFVTLCGIVYFVSPFAINATSSPSMIRHLPSADAFEPLKIISVIP